MVSGDVIQRYSGVLSKPEVRVWRHPPEGITTVGEDTSDSYLTFGEPDDPIEDRLREAQQVLEDDPIAEDYALIAYDGYEFLPYEFDQYADEYEIPDELKVDSKRLSKSREERPDADQYEDPYLKFLSLGAFLDVHDGDRERIVELLMFNQSGLIDLYNAIVESEKPAPEATELADAGIEFSESAFNPTSNP